jgi:hypothetical protein
MGILSPRLPSTLPTAHLMRARRLPFPGVPVFAASVAAAAARAAAADAALRPRHSQQLLHRGFHVPALAVQHVADGGHVQLGEHLRQRADRFDEVDAAHLC